MNDRHHVFLSLLVVMMALIITVDSFDHQFANLINSKKSRIAYKKNKAKEKNTEEILN